MDVCAACIYVYVNLWVCGICVCMACVYVFIDKSVCGMCICICESVGVRNMCVWHV
jgi:hypothetical protein